MQRWHLSFMACWMLTMASCAPSEPAPAVQVSESQTAPAAEPSEASQPSPSSTVSVQTIAQFEDRIASHNGKVVVVDLWALW